LAATAALLAGCSTEVHQWRAETVPVILVPAAPAVATTARECAPLEPEIAAEPARTVPFDAAMTFAGLTIGFILGCMTF
jgi:hypothetical protein